MLRNRFCGLQVAILAAALLCACAAPSQPAVGTPAPTPTARAVTPGAVTISPANVKDVSLLYTCKHQRGRVLDVAFSARGTYLVSSGEDLSIRVWDAATGQQAEALRMRSVDMADIDICVEQDLLASGETLWDLGTLQEVRALEGRSALLATVAFGPGGGVLALSLFEKQIMLWDVASGQAIRTFETREENRTKRMDVSPDGAILAAGVIDGTVRLYDVASGNIIRVLHYPGETDIHDLSFSPDGKYLGVGGRVPTIALWDVATWEVIKTFGLSDNSLSLAFSHDGALLASSSSPEHEVRLWDVESGKLLRTLPHKDQVMRVTFSPDGRLLAGACFDGQVYVWGIPAGPVAP